MSIGQGGKTGEGKEREDKWTGVGKLGRLGKLGDAQVSSSSRAALHWCKSGVLVELRCSLHSLNCICWLLVPPLRWAADWLARADLNSNVTIVKSFADRQALMRNCLPERASSATRTAAATAEMLARPIKKSSGEFKLNQDQFAVCVPF